MRVYFLSVVLIVGSAVPLAAYAAAPSAALEVSGWLPYWHAASSTSDALQHLNQLTEINPFGYSVTPSGDLYDPMGITKPDWAGLIAAAKAKKVRVIPTVMWSNADAIDQILSATTTRIKLETEIADIAKADNFDGIDIDFENKLARDKDYFSTFLKGLYARMGNKWVMCSIEPRMPLADRYLDPSKAPADATDYANDYVALNKYCDRVRLMTYDQGYIDVALDATAKGPYVPVADPLWVERIVDLAATTISKKKIEIGIATYGYEFSLTPLTQTFTYKLLWAFDSDYAAQLESQYGTTPVRNSAGELSFTYVPNAPPMRPASADPLTYIPPVTQSPSALQALTPATEDILWWSDAHAIADKIALATKLGIRGVAIFKLDGGEDPALWSVLPAHPAR